MLSLATARAEALFCSDLTMGAYAAPVVEAAIRRSVQQHHGVRGCVADMADEYGHHPDTAPARMAWAVQTIADLYQPRRACTCRDEPLAVAA